MHLSDGFLNVKRKFEPDGDWEPDPGISRYWRRIYPPPSRPLAIKVLHHDISANHIIAGVEYWRIFGS